MLHNLFFFQVLFFIAVLTGATSCSYQSSPPRTQEEEALIDEQVNQLLLRGALHLREAKLSGLELAETAFLLARELRPRDARPLDGIGAVWVRRGNLDYAEYWFQKALVANPDYDRSYAHLGFIAAKRGDVAAAEQLLLMAIERNPLNYRNRNNFAALLMDTDSSRRQHAREELLKSLQQGGEGSAVLQHNLKQAMP